MIFIKTHNEAMHVNNEFFSFCNYCTRVQCRDIVMETIIAERSEKEASTETEQGKDDG